jgi:hypothetical protein
MMYTMSIKEILPSKQFAIRFGTLLGILIIIVGIRQINTYKQNRPAEDVISAFIGRPTTPETIGADFLKAFWLQETGEFPTAGLKPRDPSIPRDSITGNITRELFPVIALAQQTGRMTPEMQASFADTLQEYITSEKFDVFYDISFFRPVQTNRENTLKYLNEFEKIFIEITKIPDPLPIIEKSTETTNVNILREIQPILLSYQNLEKKLLSLSVPTEALYHHMNLTNAITGTRSNLENLARIKDDPILAFAGITRYQNDFSNIRSGLQNLLDYFIQPKITEYGIQ